MKYILSLFIILLTVPSNGQKHSIQLAPYSVESAQHFFETRIKASPNLRIFYEYNLSKKVALNIGIAYQENKVKILGGYHSPHGFYIQQNIEAQLGVKYFLSKKKRLLNPFIEQDVYFLRNTTMGIFDGSYYYGVPYIGTDEAGNYLGIRTRLGVEIPLRTNIFISINSAINIGFGNTTYTFKSGVGKPASSEYPYGYGNFILSEFRIGYRF